MTIVNVNNYISEDNKYYRTKSHLAPYNNSYYTHNTHYNKLSSDKYEKTSPNFTGLNKIAKKRIYEAPEYFEKLLSFFTREEGNVGTLPNDILKLLKESKTGNLKENIKYSA